MNEPDARVLLIFAVAIGMALLIPAATIALFALRLSATAWKRFLRLVIVLAVVTTVGAFLMLIPNSGDARLYRGLIVGFAISTAIAALVADRLRNKEPGVRYLKLLRSTSSTQFVVAFIVIATNC